MIQREAESLGLPKQFSSEPNQRRTELERAIEVGYQTIKGVYGGLAATGWEKTPDTVILASTPDEFTALVCADDPENRQSLEKDFSVNAPLGWTAYTTQRVFLNAKLFEYPLEAAEIMAHETIHAWAGRNAIKFRHITAAQVAGRQDIVNYMEDRANEGLVDYSAMAGLGLLTAPITALECVDLITRARNALVIRELAKGLGDDVEKKIFRITQGTFLPKEADWIDQKIGASPFDRTQSSYFEHGLLFVAGGMNLFRHKNLFQPGELEENLTRTLTWFTNARRRSNPSLEFMGRGDFEEAEVIIRNDRLLRGDKL